MVRVFSRCQFHVYVSAGTLVYPMWNQMDISLLGFTAQVLKVCKTPGCDLISCTTPACFSTFYGCARVPTLVENSIFFVYLHCVTIVPGD